MPYNNVILGGSPLGIVGVRSSWGSGNTSTYNVDASRQFNVYKYNTNQRQIFKNANLKGNSIFTGYRYITYNREISKKDMYNASTIGKNDSKGANIRKHNDGIYDTSVLNIVTQLAGTKAQLRPTDFAYLKNVGVYPNNRLVIARRFVSPIHDNILTNLKGDKSGGFAAISTLITWKKEDEDFFSIEFGEEWTDAKADFTDVFNAIGKDASLSKLGNLGDFLGAGAGAVQLPGFMEVYERKFLAQLGVLNSDADEDIPSGNPNLIKMAKQRKTVAAGQSGSGLKANVTIKMVCEYELKAISGVDPTIVWMDIISMALRFGSSEHATYGMSPNFYKKIDAWTSNINVLIDDIAKAMKSAIGTTIEEIKQKLNDAIGDITDFLGQQNTATKDAGTASLPDARTLIGGAIDTITDLANRYGEKIGAAELQKYRVEIMGIAAALSGMPSTPWHVTIGNPLRPIFASGDMLVDNVNLTLGSELAFNDLPKDIKIEFDLKNARPWGIDEIAAKFKAGCIRPLKSQNTEGK